MPPAQASHSGSAPSRTRHRPAGDFEAAKGLASIVERVGSLFAEPQQQAAVDEMMARFKASSHAPRCYGLPPTSLEASDQQGAVRTQPAAWVPSTSAGQGRRSQRWLLGLQAVPSASVWAPTFRTPNLSAPAHPLHPQGRQVDPGHAARAKESIAANARWLEQHGQQACAWIKTQAAAAPLTVDQGRTG